MKGRHKASGEEPGAEGQEAVDKDLTDLMATIRKVTDERDQLQDQLLRTMADFQNYRRRQEDQRKQLEQFATERMVRALLPVLDNFERALAHHEDDATVESIIEGLRAVDRQLTQVLEGQRVSRIASVGLPFDPEVHEALVMEPSVEYPDNTVVGEIEAGYKMGERVIRPARVRVARNVAETPRNGSDESGRDTSGE
ncbi:MAG TPA: nucleotide exchange factor GrpE [Fimbriimonadaceae bacterium]|nr:nucleotide exchange factor GrpE [Fimbriimonadaceae bacterium]